MEGPLNIERDVVKNGVRLDCVFEGYEYRPEREEVRSQRLAGFGCVEIPLYFYYLSSDTLL